MAEAGGQKRAREQEALEFTYFKVMAKGLGPVLCLEASGLEWSGGPVKDWKTLKPTTIFGQLPMLQDGGRQINQTVAICNYIGRKGQGDGADDDEFATSQMLLSEAEDIYSAMQKFVPTVFVPLDKKQGQQGYDQFWSTELPRHLGFLEKLLAGKPSFTGSGRTVGELYLFSMLHQAKLVSPAALDQTEGVRGFYNATSALEPVARVLSGSSAYGDFSQYFIGA